MSVPCLQTDRIERIETSVDKISVTVNLLTTDIRILSVSVDSIIKRLDEQDVTLKGSNGSPGLVGAVSTLNSYMSDLYGAMRGEGDKPGLISAISVLTKKISDGDDESKWMKRLIVGWVLTTILGALGIIFKP